MYGPAPKRQRAAALQNAPAPFKIFSKFRKVLECGSPLPLWAGPLHVVVVSRCTRYDAHSEISVVPAGLWSYNLNSVPHVETRGYFRESLRDTEYRRTIF